MNKKPLATSMHTCIRFIKNADPIQEEIEIVVEANVTLKINGIELTSLLCTPQYLPEIGIGFLFNEGMIQSVNEIEQIRVLENHVIDLWLIQPEEHLIERRPEPGSDEGHFSQSKSSKQVQPNCGSTILRPEDIFSGIAQLTDAQQIFHRAHGIHCSALNDGKQNLFVVEDISRHNTLDKLSGLVLTSGQNLDCPYLFTTGRISKEIVQKAKRLKVVLIASLSSPTSQAIQSAEKAGITLVGYARIDRFNVYSHAWRINQG